MGGEVGGGGGGSALLKAAEARMPIAAHAEGVLHAHRALARLARDERPRGGFPPLVVGDFNAETDSDEIRFMTGLHSLAGTSVYFHDAWRVAGDGGAGTTWSNTNPYARKELEPDRRIDYVFAGMPRRDGIGLLESCRVVCEDEQDGVWPSDHLGVFARLRTEPL